MGEKKYTMKLDRDYYVVTANDLIKGKQKMSLREAQLLFIAISQVVYEDKDFKTYTTTVSELAAFMGIDENSLYRDLKSICKSLCQQIVEIQIGGENAQGRKKWKVFSWIQSAEYDNGILTIRLSDDIKPYLIDLESYYSQTLLGTLMTFRSYYATRLYQYLIADSGAKYGNVHEWEFTCEQLRELFQIGEKQYKLTRDLLKKTIIPALDELNKSDYAYVWDYKEHRSTKRGKPIESVSFKAIFFKNKERKEFYLKKSKPMIEQYQQEKEKKNG
ncbi:MAG: replication initiation protein [Clostridia bacterium]|nr:replication initiation protein [Clostridia bacterium]